MKKLGKIVLALAFAATGWQAAHATTITKGSTEALEFSGSSTYGSSPTWTPYIGNDPPFGTSAIVATQQNGGLDLKLDTPFAAVLNTGDCIGSGVCAQAADIVLSEGTFGNYGVALGKENLSQGLYQVSSWQTSQQIWSGYGTNYIYGGEWSPCTGGSCSTNAAVDDVAIASGTKVAGSTVTVSTYVDNNNSANDYIDVFISNFTYSGNLGIFWGTGNCGNDPIYGTVAVTSQAQVTAVPEPGSLPLLGAGLTMLGFVLRRRFL